MLAYVFWHSPGLLTSLAPYSAALTRWHGALADAKAVGASASWYLPDSAPWLAGPTWAGAVFEDWYIVEDWRALGRLESAATSPALRSEHDIAAARSRAGVGGVWRGPKGLPGDELGWSDEAPGSTARVWRRCLTLGPAPQYALDGDVGPGRVRIA